MRTFPSTPLVGSEVFSGAAPRQVKKVKLVGVGGYGMVYLVKIDGQVFAMKVLLKDHILQSKMAPQVRSSVVHRPTGGEVIP